MSEKRKRSAVWESFHFSPKKSHVICNLCDAKIVYGRSTSSMNKHLIGVHKRESGNTGKEQKQTQNKDLEAASTSSNSQARITDCFKRRTIFPQSRQVKITNLITNVVSENALPLHFTESASFKKLMNYLEPDYRVPCYETIVQNLKRDEKEIKDMVIAELKEATHVSLTTDAWTSNSNASYLALTASYLTTQWAIRSPVLDTIFLEERHTGDYLASEIKSSILNWHIYEKIVAIVHDNGSNIRHVASLRNDQWVDVPCAAHTLQLCVNAATGLNTADSTNPVAKCIHAASRLVGHFNHSVLATNELLKRQETMLESTTKNTIGKFYKKISIHPSIFT